MVRSRSPRVRAPRPPPRHCWAEPRGAAPRGPRDGRPCGYRRCLRCRRWARGGGSAVLRWRSFLRQVYELSGSAGTGSLIWKKPRGVGFVLPVFEPLCQHDVDLAVPFGVLLLLLPLSVVPLLPGVGLLCQLGPGCFSLMVSWLSMRRNEVWSHQRCRRLSTNGPSGSWTGGSSVVLPPDIWYREMLFMRWEEWWNFS